MTTATAMTVRMNQVSRVEVSEICLVMSEGPMVVVEVTDLSNVAVQKASLVSF